MARPSRNPNNMSLPARVAVVVICMLLLSVARGLTASADDINVAGLVVDYGDGRISYVWVPFTEDEISGVELLQRSGLDIVTVGFGGMGEAICQVDDTGCPVDVCRKRLCQTSDPESPFWRYSRQTSSGEWEFVALGASATKVRDGDIDAWSWTGTDPNLPALTMNELARRAGADPSMLENNEDVVPAAVRTEGGETGRELPAGALRGGIAIGVVGAVALLAVWRSRRVGRTST